MDSNWQGGDPNSQGAYYNPEQRHDHPLVAVARWPPNRRGAYYYPEQRHDLPSSSSSRRLSPNRRGPYYNPEQHHDYPSSSSRRWRRPPLLEGMPLQQWTSFPEHQPLGGFIMDPSSSRVLIPTDGNMPSHDFAPMAVSMPGVPRYHYSDSVAPRPLMPNVIGGQDQYQPHPGSAPVFPAPGNSSSVIPHAPVYPSGAGVYAQQRGSGTVFNAPGYDSNPHVTQPGAPLYAQPGDATDFSARGGNANNAPYTSAGLIPPPANAIQGASHGPVAGVPNRSCEANVLHLQGAVERARTCADFEAIIDRVIWEQRHNGVPLMEVAGSWTGEKALTDLVRSAALHLHPDALQRLFRCLVDGWIMEQKNGPYLIRHFFATLGCVHCSIFIEKLALRCFWAMITSRVGYVSMMACLENAGYTEQGAALQNTIVAHTVEIARNMFGQASTISSWNASGSASRNVMELSMNLNGNNVVQDCFLPRTPSVLLLRRGLRVFLRLRGEELQELVQNRSARYVLSRLLRTSVDHDVALEHDATQLAERILRVAAAEVHRPGDRREQAISYSAGTSSR